MKNWAANFEYSAARIHRPTSVEQIQEIVRGSRKVRALGSRHSFNDIADTPEDLVSMEHLHQVLAIDREKQTVTVQGGTAYGQLCGELHREGFSLPNLASLPHISVAGACATATHGSGVDNGCLSTAVVSMDVVVADGSLVNFTGRQLDGAAVGLGGLGVVTSLTLKLAPTFELAQDVYEELPFEQATANFEEIVSSAYSVSFFTSWSGQKIDQVWVKRRTPSEPRSEFYGAAAATSARNPLPGFSPANCTDQMGIAGPWHERLPHFRMEFTPGSGEELQAEYLIPFPNAVPALRAIAELADQIAPLLHISEVRTIAADELWMSPFYRQRCIAIHFTWKKNWAAVQRLLPIIEARLAPFQARPHWGKLFMMPPAQFQPLFERLPDFRALLTTHDPEGKFRNPFLDRVLS
ncbi:FAD-binding protein [Fimbriimonas ginsengisoli]|uniref:Alditol oxidase n=1 Tax=Fimbriimonas ginsengisoli Gsoil 348 TaxID=661478 RepID=A0A068NTC7_FIMGI|nr:FAD-binding protein [Fimbriimonas ginsengisoli]AIE86572.1 Alditol oxidase [Fimbriimonas ginsengisoli Gsoil 348]